MKKLIAFSMKLLILFTIALLFSSGPLIPKYAFAEDKFEGVTTTATSVPSTWTVLRGSTAKFSTYRVYERSGTLDLQVFGGGNTYNAAAEWITVPRSTQYESDVYNSTLGVAVRTTGTGVAATVEFQSKRPASYWPWR